MVRFILPVALAAGLFPLGTAAAESLQISDGVFANYQEYLKTIGSTRRGAFAVGPDGVGSYFIYCEESNCLTNTLIQEALTECRKLTEKQCIVMAYGREERIEYTVVPRRKTLPPDSEILANIMPQDQLKAYIVGNTMQGEYRNHRKWMEYYAEDGTLRGKADETGSFKGWYEFEDNAICYHYDGNSDWDWCAQISLYEGNIYLVEGDELVTSEFNTKWLQGNPYNL